MGHGWRACHPQDSPSEVLSPFPHLGLGHRKAGSLAPPSHRVLELGIFDPIDLRDLGRPPAAVELVGEDVTVQPELPTDLPLRCSSVRDVPVELLSVVILQDGLVEV